MLWSGGLFTTATQRAMPVGAYILAGSPMSDKSKGRDKTKSDLLAPGWGSGPGVTIHSRKTSFGTETAT